jgi:hypothetical protein|tara:strand:+ start:330 stop:587 length:258 start_codon:yes stop_codon:yes gene_type:complete
MTDITRSLEVVIASAKRGLAESKESGECPQDARVCIEHVIQCKDMLTHLGKLYNFLEPKKRLQLLGPHQHPDTYVPFPQDHIHPD